MSADERQSGPPPDDRVQANAEREAREAQLTVWMQAAQAGDADAYRQLLETIQPMIRRIVRAKIHDEAAAEDVVQNALLSIHRGRRTYRAERAFGPWMRAITRNTIVDHFRERKRKGDREVQLVTEEFADDHEESAEGEVALAPELTTALEGLPEKQREAVTLVQIEGLSVAEAALRAGVSAGALKVRAHRGYRALAKALEGLRADGQWKSERPSRAAGRTGTGASP
ncbi:MAG: RNA polymerase sigma factor [Myxococcota bacterium]